jgi:DHA2 family multidrug resistance protein
MAQAQIAGLVGRESLALAFADVFRLMAWGFLVALIIVPFCRPAPGSPGGAPISEH